MSIYWEHNDDAAQRCPTATLMGGQDWVCLDHGALVHFVKLELEPVVIVDNFNRADGNTGVDWSKSGAPVTAKLITEAYAKQRAFHEQDDRFLNVSQAPPGTSAHHLQEYQRPKRERAEELQAQYAPAWAAALELAQPVVNASEAMSSLRDGDATLKQVGWYCAGGHDVDHMDSLPADPSLRFEDPCAHGVPVYALVKLEHSTPVVDRSNDHPEVDWVRNQVGALVRVTIHSSTDVFVGKLTKYQHDGMPDHPHAIWLELVDNKRDVVIPWVDLHTCEPVL